MTVIDFPPYDARLLMRLKRRPDCMRRKQENSKPLNPATWILFKRKTEIRWASQRFISNMVGPKPSS